MTMHPDNIAAQERAMPRYRRVLELRAQGMSYRAIAKELGVSEQRVERLIIRAREVLGIRKEGA